MKLFHASIFLALILLFAKTTHAAQIRLKGDDPNLVSVEFYGEIQPADFDALRRLIEPRLAPNNSFRWFFLNSNGGDVATAMKIGRYIRMLEFDTSINSNARCLSSCVLIFAAGLNRNTTKNNIGIHRPFGTSVGSVSREDATKNYREMTTWIYDYFNEMNFPRSLPELMLSIPPEEMKMLTFDESVQFGLVGKDPVAQERDDSANAKFYGLTRLEYLARRKRAMNMCDLSSSDFSNCYKAILSGRR